MLNELVYELVQIPGPTGFESRVASRLKELIENHVDEIYIDKIGNLIAKKKGKEGKHSLALVAHMDQVSMAVLKVDEFVWFDKLGWIDFRTLPGTPVLILGEERDIPGVICSTSAHSEAGSDKPLWIDIGDRQKFVTPGDPIIFATPPRWLDDNKTLLASHSVDDRLGCSVIVEVARRLTARPRHDIYFVGSVQEEIGSFGIRHFLRQVNPDWLIASDTCFAQDAVPDVKKTHPLRDGLGILRLTFSRPADVLYPATVSFASPRLNKLLMDCAQKLKISLTMCATTGTYNDANIAYEVNPEIDSTYLLMARRYSHSPNEVVDINTAEHAVAVLCQAITGLDKWSG
jgi:putative aminopeptidase FrvX